MMSTTIEGNYKAYFNTLALLLFELKVDQKLNLKPECSIYMHPFKGAITDESTN